MGGCRSADAVELAAGRQNKGGGAEGSGTGVGCSAPVALGRPERNNVVFCLFKNFSNRFELIRSKDGLLVLKKFQIKYGFVGN
jgi:hypothetical protein